jgi:hypothetical protein
MKGQRNIKNQSQSKRHTARDANQNQNPTSFRNTDVSTHDLPQWRNACDDTSGSRVNQQTEFQNRLNFVAGQDNVRVLLLGDSHAHQMMVGNNSFAESFSKDTQEIGVLCSSGLLVQELLYLLRTNEEILKSLKNIEHVVCTIGSWNVHLSKSPEDVQVISQALILVQERLRGIFPNATIIQFQPFPPLKTESRDFKYLYGLLARVDENCYICPITNVLTSYRRINFLNDGIHLTPRGYNAIFEHLNTLIENHQLVGDVVMTVPEKKKKEATVVEPMKIDPFSGKHNSEIIGMIREQERIIENMQIQIFQNMRSKNRNKRRHKNLEIQIK